MGKGDPQVFGQGGLGDAPPFTDSFKVSPKDGFIIFHFLDFNLRSKILIY